MKVRYAASFALALLLAGLPVAAQVTRPLTAEQVDCNARQLRSLLFRSGIVVGPNFENKTFTLNYSFGTTNGGLFGFGHSDQYQIIEAPGNTPEHYLWFSINPFESKLLRNPARLQLATVSVTRNPLDSDLVAFTHPDAFAVVIDPSLSPGTAPFDKLLLIDNIEGPDGSEAGAKAGRGLIPVTTSCHDQFTEADLHVFNVLTRVFRQLAWTTDDVDRESTFLSKLVATYRGQEAVPIAGGMRTSYRVDIYPAGGGFPAGPRAAFEVLVDIADDGTMGEALLRPLPPCSGPDELHCTSILSQVVVGVIQPVMRNRFWNTVGLPQSCVNAPAGSCASPEVRFDFSERLAGTSWIGPG